MSLLFKIAGALLLLVSGTLLGFLLSSKLNQRKNFLRAFQGFLSALETNIRYRGEDIITLIKISSSSDTLDFFMDNNSGDFMDYWSSSISSIPKSYGLTLEDLNLLNDFGSLLGTTDIDGQINHIALYKTFFDTQLKKAENDYLTKGKLYKLLGFFAGAVVSLILI
jgi:stage III sporulation protein AB